MARFFTLSSLGLVTTLSTSLQGAPLPTGNPPATNAAPVTVSVPMKVPLTGATATTNAAPLAPPPEDTFNRYGKILAPGDDMAHPLKLNMPGIDVGDVKVPSHDESVMRDILEQLATLSDADIRAKLEQWPPYSRMNLKDEGAMLQRIQDFRDRHKKIAEMKARQLGLLTLTPDQEARFEKEYWEKRLQMDRDLAKQFQPIVKARELKMQEELFREFSSAAKPGALAQAPKPSSPSAPQNPAPQKPAPPVPVAQDKAPAPPAAAPQPMMQPVAQ